MSFVFTSSRYHLSDPANTVGRSSKRPALSADQLHKHASGAIALRHTLAPTGGIMPGFIPLSSSIPPSPRSLHKQLNSSPSAPITSSCPKTTRACPPVTQCSERTSLFQTEDSSISPAFPPHIIPSSPTVSPYIHSNTHPTSSDTYPTFPVFRSHSPNRILSLSEVFCRLDSSSRHGLSLKADGIDLGCKPATLSFPTDKRQKHIGGLTQPTKTTTLKQVDNYDDFHLNSYY